MAMMMIMMIAGDDNMMMIMVMITDGDSKDHDDIHFDSLPGL